jgi:hypothetical protein
MGTLRSAASSSMVRAEISWRAVTSRRGRNCWVSHPASAAMTSEMIHVWPFFADILPEGRQAIDKIGDYIKARVP